MIEKDRQIFEENQAAELQFFENNLPLMMHAIIASGEGVKGGGEYQVAQHALQYTKAMWLEFQDHKRMMENIKRRYYAN